MTTGKADRVVLCADAYYFAGELLKRLERLARLDGRRSVVWRQCAMLVRRVRLVIGRQKEAAR